jgi:O-antigen/teichoic acid export membrane protein
LFRTAKEHYHYSIWLLGTSMVQWFSGNFFLVSAAGMLGAVAVGALRMAQNIVGLCHVLFLAMENIVPAEAAQQFFTKGESGLFAYLKRVGLIGSIPVGVLLIGLTLGAPWLMTWLYGAEYQSYAYFVAAFSVVYALGYVLTILRMAMRSMHFTSPIFAGYLISAGLSILAAGPMVRQWGIGGVLAGLIGSQMLLLLVYLAFIWRKRTTDKPAQNPILN